MFRILFIAMVFLMPAPALIACQFDKDGYASNCPPLGCLDR